jgi:hypothetical protein
MTEYHPPVVASLRVVAGFVAPPLLQTVCRQDAGSADLVGPLAQKSLASSQELIAADTQNQADIFKVRGSIADI